MEILNGFIEEIIYANEENGFTVCKVNQDDELHIAAGSMPFLAIGENVKLSGKWVTHHVYGEQFKVSYYEKLLPSDALSIERYLGSGAIKGIKAKLAKKIVAKFGEDTLNILRFHPEKLSLINGISDNKAWDIKEAFEEQISLGQIVMLLSDYGIQPEISVKIYKQYQEKSIEEISKNPYILTYQKFGVNFKKADQIAMNLGIDPFSTQRLESLIKFVLQEASFKGHTYLPNTLFFRECKKLFKGDEEAINSTLTTLALNNEIFIERSEMESENKIYLKSYYEYEQYISSRLYQMVESGTWCVIEDLDTKLEKTQIRQNITLEDMQINAVKASLENSATVITGGPGTGKTTIMKCINDIILHEGYRVSLAAPTGKAAKRLAETTGFEAKTIHRLLEFDFSKGEEGISFSKNEEFPIESDYIIIDEISMVDTSIMYHLLKAIAIGSRIIMVGDVDQLPSIGAGAVLKGIIECGYIKVIRLTEIFRQMNESMIIVNSHKINSKEFPVLNQKDSDFYFIEETSGEKIVNTIVDLYSNRLPKVYGKDVINRLQVLTPTRKGVVGVGNLNVNLQKVLNASSHEKKEKNIGDIILREGDKIIQLKNNYKLQWIKDGDVVTEGEGVFNGDTGRIIDIDSKNKVLTVLFDDDKEVEYPFNRLEEIEHAFSMTVHKSQGSEFSMVIIPIYDGPAVLLTKNLLYTAITRAKDLIILVGMKKVLNNIISNDYENVRFCSLREKLLNLKIIDQNENGGE